MQQAMFLGPSEWENSCLGGGQWRARWIHGAQGKAVGNRGGGGTLEHIATLRITNELVMCNNANKVDT